MLIVEHFVAAPPSVVRNYFTDPALRARWLGVRSDLGDVGERFEMLSPNGMTAAGDVQEAAANRVVFTWGWEGHPGVPPGSTLVEIDLIPERDGTRIRLTHSGLAESEIGLHELGWEHYLSRLVEAASGGDPGPDRGVQQSG